MMIPRAIPCLLLKGRRLVKSIRFADHIYVGDPVNTVRLFNDLAVDELTLLDIDATREGREPDFEQIAEIVSESFMPVCYGGGVSSVKDAARLFRLGVEKVAITTAAVENPGLINELADHFGAQSIVVGIEVAKSWVGRRRMTCRSATRDAKRDPVDFAREAVDRGAGEILLMSVERDGMRNGYDLRLVSDVSHGIGAPVIACGGAGSIDDLRQAIAAGASAVAAGSLFVFKGPHRGVLVNYPTENELRSLITGEARQQLAEHQ